MKRTWTNALLVLIAVTAVCLSGTSVMAQRGGGGRPGGGGGFPGFGGGGGGIIELALRDEVQKELELLPGQVDDLTKLGEADRAGQRERFQGLFGGLDRNASEADRTAARERIGAEMRKIAAETQSKVDEILLPH